MNYFAIELQPYLKFLVFIATGIAPVFNVEYPLLHAMASI